MTQDLKHLHFQPRNSCAPHHPLCLVKGCWVKWAWFVTPRGAHWLDTMHTNPAFSITIWSFLTLNIKMDHVKLEFCPSLYGHHVTILRWLLTAGPCHKAWIISNWFFEHDNELTVLKWHPQSPDLNLIELLWDVVERELRALDVHPTNLLQLQDAILSVWANISKECFQHLVESMKNKGSSEGERGSNKVLLWCS